MLCKIVHAFESVNEILQYFIKIKCTAQFFFCGTVCSLQKRKSSPDVLPSNVANGQALHFYIGTFFVFEGRKPGWKTNVLPWCSCAYVDDTVVANRNISARNVDFVTALSSGERLWTISANRQNNDYTTSRNVEIGFLTQVINERVYAG